MLLVGLTGGIGSGKSTVAKIFAICGVPVLDSDQLSKDIVQSDRDVQSQIIETFGPECFVDGKLQNKVLASKAFASGEQTQILNAIIHPKVFAATEQWIASQNASYVIKESALLIESKAYLKCDLIIHVQADREVRIDRVINRNSLSRAEILARMDNQVSDEERERYSHFTIQNNPDDFLIEQVWKIHQSILDRLQ